MSSYSQTFKGVRLYRPQINILNDLGYEDNKIVTRARLWKFGSKIRPWGNTPGRRKIWERSITKLLAYKFITIGDDELVKLTNKGEAYLLRYGHKRGPWVPDEFWKKNWGHTGP